MKGRCSFMASTSTVRRWWRKWWKCNPPSMLMFGKRVRFAPELHDAVKAAEAALKANGYRNAEHISTYYPKAIGGYRCNMRRGGRGCSLHGYGIAFDLDAPKNPHYRRKMSESLWRRIRLTPAQVRAVEAIRTVNGKQVWLWLGWAIGDTMHFQINCRPKDLASGIDWGSVRGHVAPSLGPKTDAAVDEEDGMVLEKGSKGLVVKKLQEALLARDAKALPKYGADGGFGDETVKALKAFQRSVNLPASGVFDGVTAFALTDAGGAADAALRSRVNKIVSTLRSV